MVIAVLGEGCLIDYMYWFLAMLMFSALSVKAETYGDFTYTIANGTVTITDYSTSSDTLIFPSEINGLAVTRIESMPGAREPINQNVTSIVIPSSVTTLGNYAFYWLTQLPTIYIPASVIDIDELALVGLRGLIQFNVDPNNPIYCSQDGVLYSKLGTTTSQKLLRYPWKKSGSSFQIPGEVTEIAPMAFAGSDLETISIPQGVLSIGVHAFSECTKLTSLNIPASVQSVGLSMGGPNGNYIPALTSVDVDEANPYYSSQDGVLFNKNKSFLIFYPMNKGGSSYAIPNAVNHIGKCAFAYGRKLTNISIPPSVTSIGSEAFARSGLMNISIPDNVTNIESGAFEGCWSLEAVTLSSNITTIKENTFAACLELKSINIPSNVTAIEIGAFQSCGSLLAIEFPDGLQSIGQYAFAGCDSLQEITIPSSVVEIGDSAFGSCSRLNRINVSSENENFISVDGVLYDHPRSRLIAYPARKTDPIYSIPTSVSTIGGNAFSAAWALQVIKIPASVVTIGDRAFGCLNLKAVIFLGNAPEFAGEAFSGPGSTSSNNSPTTVYYMPGTTGWGATYSGRPTAVWVLQPPVISNFSVIGVSSLGLNSIKFNHNTSPGIPYRVERSPDLKSWTTVLSGWGGGDIREYQENLPDPLMNPTFIKSFYRVMQENP